MSLPSPASLGAGGPFLDAVSIVGSDARPSLDLLLRPDTSHTPPSLASLSKAAKTFATHAFVKSRFSKGTPVAHCVAIRFLTLTVLQRYIAGSARSSSASTPSFVRSAGSSATSNAPS